MENILSKMKEKNPHYFFSTKLEKQNRELKFLKNDSKYLLAEYNVGRNAEENC
jgi:hypothetical protein